MTYEEFCKKIEEELSTGGAIRFVVSNATLSSLLSQETKITVLHSNIYFGIENEEKLYELMGIGDPTVFDGISHITLSNISPTNWFITTYGAKYCCSENFLPGMDNPNLRTVIL